MTIYPKQFPLSLNLTYPCIIEMLKSLYFFVYVFMLENLQFLFRNPSEGNIKFCTV